jgi:hypothetical protein
MKPTRHSLKNLKATKVEIEMWIETVDCMINKYENRDVSGIGQTDCCLMCQTSINIKKRNKMYYNCEVCPLTYFPDRTNKSTYWDTHCIYSASYINLNKAIDYKKDLTKALEGRIKFYQKLKEGLVKLIESTK